MIALPPVCTESVLQRALRARLSGQSSDEQFFSAIRGACGEPELLDAIASQIRAEPESMGVLVALREQVRRQRAVRLSGVSRPVAALELGAVLRDRYVIEQRLGEGASGAVFKALDRNRAGLPPALQHVAIKVLHRQPDSAPTLAALRRELQCAQALSHPNVIKVYDLDRDGSLDFLTMEFLEGELLSSVLLRFRSQPMPRPRAWSIIRGIASGLQHAHEHAIVHADLRPENIVITQTGEVRILDFGASQHDAHIGLPALPSGASATRAYASCELLEGRTPDPRDDLYALACITYELLEGAHPFQGRRANEARDLGVVPIRPRDMSRRRWNTLARGLSWHRGGRSLQVDDWLKGLRPDFTNHPGPLEAQAATAALPTRARRPHARASVAATLLVMTCALGLLFVRLAPGGILGAQVSSSTRVSSILETPGETASGPPSPKPIAPKSNDRAPSPMDLQVLPGGHFAEVRLHRPAFRGVDAPFVWWTEGASAKPGIDYVHQPKATHSFPAGKDATSVFVRLLPRTASRHPGVFYIAVADRGDRSPQQITHTAVRLPSGDAGSLY